MEPRLYGLETDLCTRPYSSTVGPISKLESTEMEERKMSWKMRDQNDEPNSVIKSRHANCRVIRNTVLYDHMPTT